MGIPHRATPLSIGRLRAAALGANDGIISTASLIVGVAAASESSKEVLIAGAVGLVAGAVSMAFGDYVWARSQADAGTTGFAIEWRKVATRSETELEELTQIYVDRGVEPSLARKAVEQLTEYDTLAAPHDERGSFERTLASPIWLALTSAAVFAVGALLPFLIAVFSPLDLMPWTVSGGSLLLLAFTAAIGAQEGGAGVLIPALRITIFGAFAMAATAIVGSLLDPMM